MRKSFIFFPVIILLCASIAAAQTFMTSYKGSMPTASALYFNGVAQSAPTFAGYSDATGKHKRATFTCNTSGNIELFVNITGQQLEAHYLYQKTVTVGTNNDKTGYALTSTYNAAETAMQASSYVAPDNTGIHNQLTNISSADAIGFASVPSASSIAAAVWGYATRTLTSLGTVVTDTAAAVWASVTRTITGGTVTTVTNPVTVGTNNDKTGYALTSTYNAAETAASQSSVTALGSPMQAGALVTPAPAYANTTTTVNAIKRQTDKLPANPADRMDVSH